MSFFHLDKERCKRDGICSAVCVAGIIKNDEERSPYIEDKNAEKCISCGLCAAYCPHGACYVSNLDPSQIRKADINAIPDGDSLDIFIKTRRSVRNFKKETVDKDTLDKILDNVRYAPSAKNTHNNRWIISSSREETKKLGDLTAEYIHERSNVSPAPESLHYKSLYRAYSQGRDVIMRNAPQAIISVLPKEYDWKAEDGSIALTYFELSAHAHGVGCVWGGYFTSALRNYIPLREYLGIGNKEYVAGAQLFGYPLYKIRQITSRQRDNITYI